MINSKARLIKIPIRTQFGPSSAFCSDACGGGATLVVVVVTRDGVIASMESIGSKTEDKISMIGAFLSGNEVLQ